ncbi:hypothetical protein KJ652_04345 [Patescibacteria group bacterium]|nr:hypothetical protein [Patescibacteria group bacterium]MBU1123797.1 hypothetical protein [Patescibacteria group bacterium]MBU1910996.1 hypothetical protein [Patescibacteria group bacterium]
MADDSNQTTSAPIQSSSTDQSNGLTGDNQNIPHVTERDKKADIFSAFETLKKKYETSAVQAKKKGKEVEEASSRETVRKASSHSADRIVEESVQLEKTIHSSLSEIGVRLQEKVQSLNEVQDAIAIEEKRLKEVHDITAAADTLASLIEIHRLKKQELEEEISDEKLKWKREQEEHCYQVEFERRREEGEYERTQQERERVFTQRQQELDAKEQEIAGIRKRAETFDQEVAGAVEKSQKETESRIRKDEEDKAKFVAEEYRREKEVAQLKINTLAAKVKELEEDRDSLKSQLEIANREAKDIAVKVIESGYAGREPDQFSEKKSKITQQRTEDLAF